MIKNFILLSLPLFSIQQIVYGNLNNNFRSFRNHELAFYAKQLKIENNELLVVDVNMYCKPISISINTHHECITLKKTKDINHFFTQHTKSIIFLGKITKKQQIFLIKNLYSKYGNVIKIYFIGNKLISSKNPAYEINR